MSDGSLVIDLATQIKILFAFFFAESVVAFVLFSIVGPMFDVRGTFLGKLIIATVPLAVVLAFDLTFKVLLQLHVPLVGLLLSVAVFMLLASWLLKAELRDCLLLVVTVYFPATLSGVLFGVPIYHYFGVV